MPRTKLPSHLQTHTLFLGKHAWQVQNSSKATAEAEENCFQGSINMVNIYSNYSEVSFPPTIHVITDMESMWESYIPAGSHRCSTTPDFHMQLPQTLKSPRDILQILYCHDNCLYDDLSASQLPSGSFLFIPTPGIWYILV